MSNLSEAEKAVYLAATERRKANGIRLRRLTLTADAEQIEAFNIIFSEWVTRYGKQEAVDHLILLICRAEARFQDKLAWKEKNGKEM